MIKQLSIFVENKAGRLAEITALLAKAGVDIRALSVADTTNFGILRLIVDKPTAAEQVLRDAGLTVSLTDVIAVGIPDQPGGFASAMKALAEESIDIEYMYSVFGQKDGLAYMIFKVKDVEAFISVLEKYFITVADNSDLGIK